MTTMGEGVHNEMDDGFFIEWLQYVGVPEWMLQWDDPTNERWYVPALYATYLREAQEANAQAEEAQRTEQASDRWQEHRGAQA